MATAAAPAIETHPLTPDRWRDFAALMNSRFDTRRCWCMAPRRPDNYKHYSAESNRRAIKKAVDTAPAPPGVLAYVDGAPAGWCAVAPREDFGYLRRYRATAPVDEQPVWSVMCFYVLRSMRRRGLHRRLLSAAVELAAEHGAKIVEAYPIEHTRNVYWGVPSVYRDAGFEEVVRRAANRPILRYRIKPRRQARGAVR